MQNDDFFKMLELEMNKEESYDNNCLITNESLEKIHITLQCKHKFNYKPLINEIIKQKIFWIKGRKYKNNLETQKLTKYQMKCPYCRTIQNGILPYISSCKKTPFVNWPEKYSLKLNKCPYQFKSGKRKNQPCNKPCSFEYCKQHLNLLEKRKEKKNKTESVKCSALTRKGNQCSRKTISSLQPFCLQHSKLLKNKKKIPGCTIISETQTVTI